MEELYWRLVHAAEIQEDEVVKDLLYEAAREIYELLDKLEELKESRNCITMSVSISGDKMKEAVEQAFQNIVGKDMAYVVAAVHEKMEREGELVGEQEQEAQEETARGSEQT